MTVDRLFTLRVEPLPSGRADFPDAYLTAAMRTALSLPGIAFVVFTGNSYEHAVSPSGTAIITKPGSNEPMRVLKFNGSTWEESC